VEVEAFFVSDAVEESEREIFFCGREWRHDGLDQHYRSLQLFYAPHKLIAGRAADILGRAMTDRLSVKLCTFAPRLQR
jgi:hypothetical protein